MLRGVWKAEKTGLLLLHIPFTILISLTIPIHFHSFQALSNSLFESTRPAGVRLLLLAVEEPSHIYIYPEPHNGKDAIGVPFSHYYHRVWMDLFFFFSFRILPLFFELFSSYSKNWVWSKCQKVVFFYAVRVVVNFYSNHNEGGHEWLDMPTSVSSRWGNYLSIR